MRDLSDIPDADIERMKAIRDAARAKNEQPPINELGRNNGRTIDNFGPDIDPSSKASVEVEGRRVPSDTA